MLAEHGGPASHAQQLAARQNIAGSAGGRRFTPAQRAVAAALMVVVERAMKDGKDAACEAMLTLGTNSPATRFLLVMLPEEGALPTMKDLEREASELCHGSLTFLAKVCAEARCQPLEVFTRSVDCTACKAALQAMSAPDGGVCEKLKQTPQQPEIPPLSWFQETEQALQQLGAQQSMAVLILSFLKFYMNQMSDDKDTEEATRLDIAHMLPGTFQSLSTRHDYMFFSLSFVP